MNPLQPHRFLAAFLPALSAASLAIAQPAATAPPTSPAANTDATPKPVNILAGRPDAEPVRASALLGAAFESQTAGIRFRPPADTEQVNRPKDAIAEYVNDKTSWLLRVTRYVPPTPVPLTEKKLDENGEITGGLLGFMAQKEHQANVSGKVLRKDVVNVDSNYVGMIAMRFNMGNQRWLRQHAIVQVNDQLYFIFVLTTPAGQVAADVDPAAIDAPDPGEKLAVETFSALIDSIKIVDRTGIKQDQDQRLYRTRALMVFWNEKKLTGMLVPKQFFRILKEGKDIGYSFVEEMPDTQLVGGVGIRGIAAYVRAHTEEKDQQNRRQVLDIGSYRFVSFDQHRETFTRSTVLQADAPGGPTETHNSEFGNSVLETRKIFAGNVGVRDPNDPKSPPMRPSTYHALDVSVWGKDATAEPTHIELPPFYLPQASTHFLPRLAMEPSFTGPRTYLFASYVPETRLLMMRYVDVSEEKELAFAGQTFRGYTVNERLGLDGSITTHYLTDDGKYLGNENKDTKTTILPSDDEAIRKIWNNPNLTRPERLQPPKESGAIPGSASQQPAHPAPARGLPPPIQ